MAVKLYQHVGCKFVQLALAPGVRVERLAQSRAAEVAEKQQPFVQVAGEDLRRAEASADQPFGDGDERPRVLVRWRRVHQDCAAIAVDDPKIAAKRRIARQRQNFRSLPAAGGKEIGRMLGRLHSDKFILEAIAPPMTGAPWLSRFARRSV